jgi:hypothetical protein
MPANRVSKDLLGGKVLPPYDGPRRVGRHHHADEQGFKRPARRQGVAALR